MKNLLTCKENSSEFLILQLPRYTILYQSLPEGKNDEQRPKSDSQLW
jgi:hypothetical protein